LAQSVQSVSHVAVPLPHPLRALTTPPPPCTSKQRWCSPSSVATVMRNVCHLDGKSDRSLGESECYQSVYMYMLKCTCQVESQVTSDVCDSRLNTSTIKRKKRDCRFVNVIPERPRAPEQARRAGTHRTAPRGPGAATRGGCKGGRARGVQGGLLRQRRRVIDFNLQLHACEMTRLVLLLAGVRSRPLRRWTVM